MAVSYYYFKAFPEKLADKAEEDAKHGIKLIEETFSTGIQVLLIDLNKLDPSCCDSHIEIKPKSKNHILIHIGYTFGAQSGLIIEPLLMLFGHSLRSINVIGKAGALVGDRTDILACTSIYLDKTNEIININEGNLEKEKLEKMTGRAVHVGPMLTVAGTILQNSKILRFYKYIQGCVGLEMEGFYFAEQIEKSVKEALIRPDFITRCFYYASDLPLDPNQNLSQEGENVSWDEGIASMNAIQRYVLNKIFTE